ncbi:MAG: hypothetical protein U0401_33295 [Anaerolineae bacterium]
MRRRQQPSRVDFPALQNGIEQAGVPIGELVRQLRAQVGGTTSGYIHWGATGHYGYRPDPQIRDALHSLEQTLLSFIKNLAALAGQHRSTLMAGRTRSKALPIPFGLKVGGWRPVITSPPAFGRAKTPPAGRPVGWRSGYAGCAGAAGWPCRTRWRLN